MISIAGGSANSFGIGGVKTTVRNTLGEDWLLCNKAPITEEEYPKLFSLIDKNLAKEYSCFETTVERLDEKVTLSDNNGTPDENRVTYLAEEKFVINVRRGDNTVFVLFDASDNTSQIIYTATSSYGRVSNGFRLPNDENLYFYFYMSSIYLMKITPDGVVSTTQTNKTPSISTSWYSFPLKVTVGGDKIVFVYCYGQGYTYYADINDPTEFTTFGYSGNWYDYTWGCAYFDNKYWFQRDSTAFYGFEDLSDASSYTYVNLPTSAIYAEIIENPFDEDSLYFLTANCLTNSSYYSWGFGTLYAMKKSDFYARNGKYETLLTNPFGYSVGYELLDDRLVIAGYKDYISGLIVAELNYRNGTVTQEISDRNEDATVSVSSASSFKGLAVSEDTMVALTTYYNGSPVYLGYIKKEDVRCLPLITHDGAYAFIKAR